MRNLLKTTMMYAVIACSMLMTACTTDLYKPDVTEPEKPGGNEDVPGDHTWATNKTTQLTVNVRDEYDGKYYYTVEVFTDNPAISENAKLLSGAKTNSKVPFSVEVVIPDVAKTIFIRQTDPFKRKRVYAFDVKEGNMVCNLGNGPVTKSALDFRSNGEYTIPEINFEVPSNAIAVSKGTKIETGKNYVLKQGTSFALNGLPGEGNFSLYIVGTVELEGDVTLQQGAKFFILKEGKLVPGKSNKTIRCVGNAQIAVESGGYVGDDKTKLNISLTDNTRIVNAGKIELEGEGSPGGLSLSASAEVYNRGEIDVNRLSASDAKNKIVNTGDFDVDETATFTNVNVYNACVFDVDKCNVNGAKMYLASGSIFEVDKFTAGGLEMLMEPLSIFDCTDDDKNSGVHFTAQKSIIKGTANNAFALFRTHKIVYNGGNTVHVDFLGGVEIECKGTSNGNSTGKYTVTSPACFAEGQASVEIPDDECNSNSGNHNPGTGEGDTDDGYEEEDTLPYTYMFEDNWPAKGDYDMNDLVMTVEINNIKSGNVTTGARIISTLHAVGAAKQLAAAFQLDGISATAVSNSEGEQKYAVLSLFEDAHAELGASSGEIANTFKISYPSKQRETAIAFTQPITGVINAKNFNLFIVWGGMNVAKRNEIHLAGFKGTDKAGTNPASTDVYTTTEDNWMWALSVPQADFATYPKESILVSEAYSGFSAWQKGDETPGWYNTPVEGKVISVIEPEKTEK